MRRQIEDMQNAERPNSVWERIGERLLESDQIGTIANSLVTALLRGTKRPVQSPSMQTAIQATDSEAPPPNALEIGGSFVERIREGFSDEREMRDYLNKVAALFSRDPETMKRVIDTIAKQNEIA